MNSCNQKLCRNHVQPNISLGLLQLLIRCSLFVCCVPPNSVVQINNIFKLILFSAEIRKRRGKKLISKTIKYKLGSSSKMPFALFPERHLFIHLFIYIFIYLFIWKQLILSKIWNDAYGRGRQGREVMFFASLWRSANENRYVIHP